MKEYLQKLPKETQGLIKRASDIAAALDMSAYLVGGCVRDLLLGTKVLDLDIVVVGDGIRFAEEFAGCFQAKLIRHRRFGTATVIISPAVKIDIATARKEIYPHPASLPQVSAGTLRDDLYRRDFSINAMAISICRRDFGALIDWFSGRADLRKKKIRILHSLSFIDDPTRLLRAIRFEQRYAFKIEPGTLSRLKESVRLKMLEKVQPQRVCCDLILMLKEKYPIKEIKRLKGIAGFDFISSRLRVTQKTYVLLRAIEKQLGWFRKSCPLRRQLDTWLVYFMGLTDSLSAQETKALCRKFALLSGEEKRMLSYKKFASPFVVRFSRRALAPADIFALFEPLSYEAILLVKAKYKNTALQRHIEDFFEIYNGMRIAIGGKDLQGLGLLPGPHYQKIFAKVLQAKLNGMVKTKQDELKFIAKLL